METPETTEEIIVRVTVEQETRPRGTGRHEYEIAMSRPELAAKAGLPEAEAVKVAERLARRHVITRARYSDGKVYYCRMGLI